MQDQSLIEYLISKKYKVFVGGEWERDTDLFGAISLLAKYSDFMDKSDDVKDALLKEWIEKSEIYIDSNIYIKIV